MPLPKTNWENLGGDKRGRRRPASQNPSCWNPSWEMLRGRTLSETVGQVKRLASDNLETNPITTKLESVSHFGRADLLAFLTLLLSAWTPLPNKVSCFVFMCISSDNSFLSVG